MVICLDIDLSYNIEESIIVIKDFLVNYLSNSKCKSVVIGLSGGIDSAVTAVICKEAIGKNNVLCLFLPDKTTSKLDIDHHNLLVDRFNLKSKTIEISDLVKNIEKICVIKPDKYCLANVKARLRMNLLYEYANSTSSLVCGTSNKSELLTGYFTKYGDGGVDIFPIGDLYKTQVWELAKYLKIPKAIITKSPTAGLWHGQTDEKELKLSYKQLDIILFGLERKIDYKDISRIAKVKNSDIERIKNMRINSQHKRKTPLVPKIGLRTSGLDWRSPTNIG